MKNALIYCRVSTDEQAGDDRHSLKTQEAICLKAIEESGEFKIANNGVYVDPGKSATNMNRPGLQDLLIRIQEDKTIGAVYVQDTDRLARNAGDHLTIKALFQKNGVRLISVSQPGIENTPEGNFMDLVIAGVNQLQSQITARKTIKSMEQKFWEGGWPTHAPKGYLNASIPGNDKKRTVIIDPERGSLIKEAFHLYSTGDYSVIHVRDLIHKKGFRTLQGKRLHVSKMIEILKNPFYFGEMRWRGLVNKGNHTPLIDKATYIKCQNVMAEHNRYASRRRKYNFTLRGFVFCDICGQRYTAEHNVPKKKSYYHCNRAGDQIKCTDKYVEVHDLEGQVQRKFDKLQFSPDFVEKIEKRARYIYETRKNDVSSEISRLEKMRASLQDKLETAEEKLIQGLLSDDGFTRAKTRYREQITAVEEEVARIGMQRNLRIDVIQQILGLIRNIGEAYKNAPPDIKRLYLSLFWEGFKAKEKKIVKATKSPIVRALEELGSITDTQLQKPALSRAYVMSENSKVIISTVGGAYRDLNPD